MIRRVIAALHKRTRRVRVPEYQRGKGDGRELRLREAEAESARMAAYKQILERETDTWRKRYAPK